MPTERQVTLEQALEHIARAPVTRPVTSVIVHHTERPTGAQYAGMPTIQAVRRYHVEERGWSDNGYHIMVGPPGDIFLCRPLELEGAHTLGQNAHSVGLSYVADFDTEAPAAHAGLAVGQRLVAAMLGRWSLGLEAIRFHREFAVKSCPGWTLELEEYRREVAALCHPETGGRGLPGE